MIKNWYIATLVLIAAFLGVNQEHTKVANQQIVLQFTDEAMSSVADHNTALAAITKKLAAFGIANIEVVKNDDTQLSIRYYSDIDALNIRKILSQESALLTYRGLNHVPVDFPEDKLPDSCNIIVSDIQYQSDGGLELNGKLSFEIKQDYQRLSNPVIVGFVDFSVEQNLNVQVAFKVNNAIAIAIDNTSRIIPEVRAGPRNIC